MDYLGNYQYWLDNDYFDNDTKAELLAIKGNDLEIKERFHKDLEFGTGGLRGIIGAGTNRINIYTVRKATQGFANFLLSQDFAGKDPKQMSVAIAYDSRRMSPEFAEQAALVMNGNDIKAYVFEALRPTPELSFAVRNLGCAGGIVITASHNPPEYNGYKVYGADGGQVPFPKDAMIIDEVNRVGEFSDIKTAPKNEAVEKGLFHTIGAELDAEYDKAVLSHLLNPEIIKEVADDFRIVYTPLHGTGNKPVRRVLAAAGFKHIHVVKEQEEPDSEFTTVGYPNPEDPKAFKLALELADKVDAHIIVGTDPDADRVGTVVKNAEGQYVVLTGNMTGVLLTEYILSQMQERNKMPVDGVVISTIVSTNLTPRIAANYGVNYIEVLTGFKYIGEKIKNFELGGNGNFIFGFEESYGCLAGTYARDKDAVEATMLICEMAAYYKKRNMTLYDGLLEIYEKYGYFKESVEAITLKGIEGKENMNKIMESFKNDPPKFINGKKVIKAYDYNTSIAKDLLTGEISDILLPKSDVLYYITEDESWLCVRPSGTEPKIKIYFGVVAQNQEKANEKLTEVIKDTMAAVDAIQNNTPKKQLKHIIIWDYMEGISPDEAKLKAADIKVQLEGLKENIKEVKDIKVHINPLETSNGDVILISTFANQQDLEIYRDHPDHVRVASVVRSFLTNRRCMDFMA